MVTLQARAGSDLYLGEEKGAYLFLQSVVAGTQLATQTRTTERPTRYKINQVSNWILRSCQPHGVTSGQTLS